MKGTITMEFDGPKTKISTHLEHVSDADKCQAIDNLMDALEIDGLERLMTIMALTMATEAELKKEKEEVK